MFSYPFAEKANEKIQEGDLYKTLNIYGRTFTLYYGYYEECERNNLLIEPMPIYPDFISNPEYTDKGQAYVTKMQDACKHFTGKFRQYNECAECEHYLHGDDLIGICTKNGVKETNKK